MHIHFYQLNYFYHLDYMYFYKYLYYYHQEKIANLLNYYNMFESKNYYFLHQKKVNVFVPLNQNHPISKVMEQ